jgi:hypothetical protein
VNVVTHKEFYIYFAWCDATKLVFVYKYFGGGFCYPYSGYPDNLECGGNELIQNIGKFIPFHMAYVR